MRHMFLYFGVAVGKRGGEEIVLWSGISGALCSLFANKARLQDAVKFYMNSKASLLNDAQCGHDSVQLNIPTPMYLKILFLVVFSLTHYSDLGAQRVSRKATVNERWLIQQDSSAIDSILQYSTLRPNWLAYGWGVYFDPLIIAFSDEFVAGFQVKRARKSFVLDFTFANTFTGGAFNDIEAENYLKVRLSPEFRLDFSNRRRWYVGMALPFYYARRTTPLFGFDGGSGIRVGDINFRTIEIGLLPKIGGQFLIGRRIVVDGYLGLGASYTDAEVRSDRFILNPDLSVSTAFNCVSAGIDCTPAAGLRLGWWF